MFNKISFIKNYFRVSSLHQNQCLLLGVTKLQFQTCDTECTASLETQLLHHEIENLRNKVNRRSHQTDKLIVQLTKVGIEIRGSQLDRQTVVVWIWCSTQAALEHVQKLYESNQLRNVFFEITLTPISTVINIDKIQLHKT